MARTRSRLGSGPVVLMARAVNRLVTRADGLLVLANLQRSVGQGFAQLENYKSKLSDAHRNRRQINVFVSSMHVSTCRKSDANRRDAGRDGHVGVRTRGVETRI